MEILHNSVAVVMCPGVTRTLINQIPQDPVSNGSFECDPPMLFLCT